MGDISANFSRHEFACKCGCGFDTVDTVQLQNMEALRQHYGVTVTVNSGCRCPAYNMTVGGAPNSQHLLARATDFTVEGVEPEEVQDYIDRIWPDQFGMGRYNTFTHLDSRPGKARW